MLNPMPALDAAAHAATAAGTSSGRGAILPSAVATLQSRTETGTLRMRPRRSWDGGRTGQRVVAGPSMPGLGDLGNQSILAGQRNPYVQCNPSSPTKQFPYTTRFAAAGGDAKGPHPARDPV